MTFARLRAHLVWRSLARAKSATAVSVVSVAIACAVGYSALALGPALARPWDRAFAAAQRPHLIVSGADAQAVARVAPSLEGVRDREGPRTTYTAGLRIGDDTYGALVTEAGETPPRVDRPVVVGGRWIAGAREVVLERTFAAHHDVAVGDHLVLSGEDETVVDVVGLAALVTREPYPRSQPGAAFASRETLAMAGVRSKLFVSIALSLDDPDSAPALAQRVELAGGGGVQVETWQEMRDDAVADMRPMQAILGSFAILLAVGCGAVLVIVLAAKVLERARDVALLRAVGFTPRDVGTLLLGELSIVALLGVLIGVAVGALVVPVLASGADLAFATVSETPFSSSAAVAAAGAAAGVVAVVAAVAMRRSSGVAVTRAAAAPPSGRRLQTLAGRIARSLGGPAVAVGTAGAFARRGRMLLTVVALTLTGMTLVAALSMEATFVRSREARAASALPPPIAGPAGAAFAVVEPTPDEDRLRPLVYSLNGVLLVVGLASLVVTSLLSLRERVADIALMKAIGMTPRDVAISALSGAVLLALLGALLSIPLGLGFFRIVYTAAGGAASTAGVPAPLSVALAVLGLVLVSALSVSGIALKAAHMAPAAALTNDA